MKKEKKKRRAVQSIVLNKNTLWIRWKHESRFRNVCFHGILYSSKHGQMRNAKSQSVHVNRSHSPLVYISHTFLLNAIPSYTHVKISKWTNNNDKRKRKRLNKHKKEIIKIKIPKLTNLAFQLSKDTILFSFKIQIQLHQYKSQ